MATWTHWCNDTTTTITGTWTSWNTDSTSSLISNSNDITWASWTLEAQRERWRKEEEERETKRREAAARAEELLRANLSEEQQAELDAENGFTMERVLEDGSRRRYFIRRGRQHNVFRLDEEGRRIEELCCHVRRNVPDADNMLAQKLLLEHQEDRFRKESNIWSLWNTEHARAHRRLISGQGEEAAAA